MKLGRAGHGSPPVHRSRFTGLTGLLAVAALLAFAGCSGPGADQAGQVAESFARSVADEPAKACDLLAPGTREEVEKATEKTCAEGLGDEDLPEFSALVSVDAYGHDAIARLGNDRLPRAVPRGLAGHRRRLPPRPDDQKPFRLRRLRRLT